MWSLLWPIMTVVAANCLYNVCAKQTPGDVNTFASLSVTYLIASAMSLAAFFLSGAHKSFLHEAAKLNWTAVALGVAIVALEFGYINVYRAGWKVSLASLVANISLALPSSNLHQYQLEFASQAALRRKRAETAP